MSFVKNCNKRYQFLQYFFTDELILGSDLDFELGDRQQDSSRGNKFLEIWVVVFLI